MKGSSVEKQIVSMEEKTSNLKLTTKDDCALAQASSLRETPPAHYTLKIESFSSLSSMFKTRNQGNYESDVFEASGYKWKLSLYPNGDKKGNGKGYISLYLIIAETDNLPLDWEVKADFKLFVFDHKQDKYLTVQGANGDVRRFHSRKIEWGFAKLLPLSVFKNPDNGYLSRDTCLFGAEVFVIYPSGKGECLTLLEGLETHTWRIDKFSSIEDEEHYSDVFTTKNRKWKLLLLYPKGDSEAKDKSLSLFLCLVDLDDFPSGRNTYAKYTLRIVNRLRGQHVESSDATSCFSTSSSSWGHAMLSLTDLHDISNGFLVNDTLIVQVVIEEVLRVNT